ncbi:MAG: acetyl-CoA carboxylase biotin carboxylase subunit [Fimbriimonadales bacterium]|nr:MAG: acetyl-CoA carboxylase biotin carboxylase subunit [Fimbriimonadales bacterium]
MFSKILIANRGEIACRIIRACKALGIRTVAIYSEADRESLHVMQADEAVCVGPPPNDQSYLDMPNVLMAAVITGADAVHPGYGYFSERENFADALEAIGIKFIGPPVEAIAQMGDKARAREAAMEAGVPVVPGSEGVVRTESEALEIAEAIGYPVLIKAAAGGGGRGIRKATNPENLVSQMQTARQEAEASFGSGAVYIEKLIENPRHVEVQIIADAYGSCVHLGERECSVQNLRHQKMIEEAPFALLSPEKRQEIGEAAVRIARQVGYVNAGTVEFLMDAEGNYYFIEMNTRLQVEHPVTEQVTGIDIVRTQIEVAAGKELPFTQEDITWTGHAIEARITAEDPDRNFAPSCGKITEWNPPKGEPIRLESHLYRGFEVSPFYDPMIAKLIVTAHDRVAAVELLSRALDEFRIEGIKTNIPFLKHLVQTEEYVKGDVHTQTVAQMMQPAEAHAR